MKIWISFAIIIICIFVWFISPGSGNNNKKEPVKNKSLSKLISTTENQRYNKHLEKLKSKIPSKDFTVVIAKPFVVIGNHQPKIVQIFADRVVKDDVTRLKKMYFKKDPAEIIDIPTKFLIYLVL